MSGHRRRLWLVDAPIDLLWDSPRVRDVALSLYGDAAGDDRSDAGTPGAQIRLACGAEGMGVRLGDAPVAWRRLPSELFQDAEMAIVHASLDRLRRRHLLLHAAVAADAGGAVIAIGPHGSGKTTLAVALGRGGAAILSDEVAPVDPGDLQVAPFPRDLILHRGTLRAAPGLPPSPGFKCFPGYRYLPPSAVHGADREVPLRAPVRGILFPSRQSGAAPELQPVGAAEVARRLLDQCFDLPGLGGRRVTETIASLAARPAARLLYDDAPAAAARVRAWMAGLPPV